MARPATRTVLRLTGLAAIVLGFAVGAAAASGQEWSIGELPGGDVRSLAIHPADPDVVFAGTGAGQVFRSVDGGDSWRLAGQRLPFRGWVVSDLEFDPQDPQRLWAALRGAWGQDGLVALSEDGGRSWSNRSAGLPGRQVYALALSRQRIFAATREGVWGSDDRGESWRCLTCDHAEIQKVGSLLVDPGNPRRVFAGTWRRAYRSDDGGESWSGVFDGMILDSEVFSLHAVPGSNREKWASTCGWVYRSSDNGNSWRRFENGLAERRTPSFLVLPGKVRLAGTVAGLYRSEDGGASWHRVTDTSLVALSMASHPEVPERVFLATEGAGVWRSEDGGRSFLPVNRGLSAARIAALAEIDGEMLAAVRHSGPASGVYRSVDGGRTFSEVPADLPEVTALAATTGEILAATVEGLFARRADGWALVEEVGRQPIRQLVTEGQSVAVRADGGIYRRSTADGVFEKVAFTRGEVSSLALASGALWLSSIDGKLFRMSREGVVASATPVDRGKVHAVDSMLLISDGDELWSRAGLEAAWKLLGQRVDFHATGDRDFPLLLVGNDGVARLKGRDGRADRVLGLDVPPQHLSAALLRGQNLVLGTSSYGLLLSRVVSPGVATPAEGLAR